MDHMHNDHAHHFDMGSGDGGMAHGGHGGGGMDMGGKCSMNMLWSVILPSSAFGNLTPRRGVHAGTPK